MPQSPREIVCHSKSNQFMYRYTSSQCLLLQQDLGEIVYIYAHKLVLNLVIPIPAFM